MKTSVHPNLEAPWVVMLVLNNYRTNFETVFLIGKVLMPNNVTYLNTISYTSQLYRRLLREGGLKNQKEENGRKYHHKEIQKS